MKIKELNIEKLIIKMKNQAIKKLDFHAIFNTNIAKNR